MKEIKFRAWHKLYKKMYEVHDLILNSQPNETEPLVWANCWGRDLIEDKDIILHVEKLELMQFTGLKDKNGKEIYEGDIVQTANGYYIVKYIEEHAAYYYETINGELHDRLNQYLRSNKVIGNIYENPELLE